MRKHPRLRESEAYVGHLAIGESDHFKRIEKVSSMEVDTVPELDIALSGR